MRAIPTTDGDEDTSVRDKVDRFFSEAWVWPEAKEDVDPIPIDVLETEDDLIVKASLPGLRSSDVTLEVNQGVLTITGVYRDEYAEKLVTWHLQERRAGLAQRSIVLPVPVNEDVARARLRDGVLTVALPKVARSSRRRIEVLAE